MRAVRSAEEVGEKLDRVRTLLERSNSEGALFAGQNTVAWVTGGLENDVVRGADPGFVWALVTRDEAFLITQNVEGPRLKAEEAPAEIGFQVATFPWEEDRYWGVVEELCDPSRLVNDGHGPGKPMVDELQKLRLELTSPERERIRALGREACEALEDAVRSVSRGMSESELAGEIALRLERSRIVPGVVLVGADERRRQFRHPIVGSEKLDGSVLAAIVGRRGGLNVALTRTATLGPVPDELARRHLIACEAEARMMRATVAGSTYGDALQAGLDAYEALGFPGEWRHHLQGGPIGYGPREFGPAPLAKPDRFTRFPIAVHHACAWNPTVQGTKSEDTFLVCPEGPELISNSASWPSVEFEDSEDTVPRPAILELG